MVGLIAYSVLSLFGIIILAASYWRTRKLIIFGVFLAMIGVYVFAEYPVLIWGEAYKYFPGILPTSKFDNLLGSMVSGILCLPAIAVLIAALSLNWGWVVVAAAWFCVVEELFIKLNIYEQSWWSTWFTFLSVISFNWIAKFIFRKMDEKHGRIWSYLVLILTIVAVRMIGELLIYAIIESRVYKIDWLVKIGLPSTAINAPISIIVAVIYATLIIYTKQRVWKIITVASIFFIDLLMKRMQYIQTVNSWDSVFFVLVEITAVAVGTYFGRLYSKNEEKPRTYSSGELVNE